MKRCLVVIGALALVVTGCGDDDLAGELDVPGLDGDSPVTIDDPTEVTDADARGSTWESPGAGTVTVGDTTWEIEGTCNSPMEGIVLLSGNAVEDTDIEIYVTATPAVPDSASAYVTHADGTFDWSAGSSLAQFDIETPETSYEDDVGRGSAEFIDLSKPTLEPVVAEGSWEFGCSE